MALHKGKSSSKKDVVHHLRLSLFLRYLGRPVTAKRQGHRAKKSTGSHQIGLVIGFGIGFLAFVGSHALASDSTQDRDQTLETKTMTEKEEKCCPETVVLC